MLRDVEIEEIWDGRFYSRNDMVKAGCNDCSGCSDCCHGMEDTILLDPMDVYRLGNALSLSFEEQISASYVEVGPVDGLLLPHLKVGEGACPFLNEEERCSIHPHRPGICRLFPLGRYYTEGSFRYFLQQGECTCKNRYKVRVSKWIDIPDPGTYEKYICDWHYFTLDASRSIEDMDEENRKAAMVYILKFFYSKPWQSPDGFYSEFYSRLREAEDVLDL